MLTCKQITELCTEFEEGELPFGQWAQFRTHLLMCGACMDYVQQMRMTAATLRKLPTASAIPDDVRVELSRRFQEWYDESDE